MYVPSGFSPPKKSIVIVYNKALILDFATIKRYEK